MLCENWIPFELQDMWFPGVFVFTLCTSSHESDTVYGNDLLLLFDAPSMLVAF